MYCSVNFKLQFCVFLSILMVISVSENQALLNFTLTLNVVKTGIILFEQR